MAQVAFAPDVFTWPDDEPQLIGSTCQQCGATTFPMASACPRCGTPDPERVLLPREGTLVSFTTQGFIPKEPFASGETAATFRPFGVGLVQLDDVVRVEVRLTEPDPDRLEIGMPVRLVAIPFRTDEDGTEVLIPAFEPVR